MHGRGRWGRAEQPILVSGSGKIANLRASAGDALQWKMPDAEGGQPAAPGTGCFQDVAASVTVIGRARCAKQASLEQQRSQT